MPTAKASKLCKSLLEILRDSHSPLSMLDYFIQYAESVGALHIVQFWLCVESFRATAHSPAKEPSPAKSRDSRTRPNTLDRSESSTSPLSSEVACLVKGKGSHGESRIGSATEKSHEKSRDGGSLVPSSNGSPRIRKYPSRGGPMTPGSSPGSPGSNGRDKHKVLQRRDTENHKYCNCRIHALHQQESLSSSLIHGMGCGGVADEGGSGGSSELHHNNVNHSPAMIKRPIDDSSPVNKSNQSSPAQSRSNGSSPRSLIGSQHHTHSNHLQSQHHSPKRLG